MKVLMISGDPAVLDSNSAVGKRTEEYRQVFGELDVLVCQNNILNFFAGFINGFQLLRKKKFDVITAQSPEHWFFAWVYSKIFKIPWQMQIHTDILNKYFWRESLKNKIRAILAKFLILRASCIRVVSEKIKNSLTAYGLRPKAVAVLPIFVDMEKIKNAQIKIDLHDKYGKDKFIILMASRLTREKNIGLAVEALSSLIRANKRIQLIIVGNGPEEKKLKLRTMDYELWTNVAFEPWINNLASYYKTCDLFLLTSNYEGYGMTLLEAAACGAKIVSSNVGIAPEILDPENIFKVGDKNDLKSKLKLAIERKIKPAKPLRVQTKEDYLMLYKESLEQCLKK